VFFASLEPGNNYVTRPIILNTALYYALGYARGGYVNKPTKQADKKAASGIRRGDQRDRGHDIRESCAADRDIRYTSELANARSDEYIQYNRLREQKNTPTGKIGTRKQIQPGADSGSLCLHLME